MLQSWAKESLFSVLQVSIAVASVQLLLIDSVSVSRVHVVTQPLQIHLNHQSPPYIALQEVLGGQVEIDEEAEGFDDSSSLKLNTKNYVSLKLDPLKIQAREFTALRLPALKLSRYAFIKAEPRQLLAEDGIQQLSNPKRLTYIETEWIEDLSPRQRERLRAASERTQVLAQNWSIPDFNDLAQVKLFELSSNPPEAKDKKANIVVRLPSSNASSVDYPIPLRPPTAQGKGRTTDGSSAGEQRLADHSDGQDDSAFGDRIIVASEPSFVATSTVQVRPKRQQQSPVRITGPVELIGGLALGAGEVIEVFREEEGYRIEEAFVDLAHGSYEIDLPVRYGKLVAQLITSDGRITGRGELNLSDFDEVSRAQGIYQGLKISLDPYREGLAGITASAYSFGDTQYPVASQLEAQGLEALFVSDEEGRFHLPVVSSYSSMMMRAYSPTHAESLTCAVAGAENQVQLMPDKMLGALEKFLKELGWEMGTSVQPTLMWGRVLKGNKAVPGIRVSSEISPHVYPLYFGEDYLPDPKLDRTSGSGIFVFVGLPVGFHPLLAVKDEIYWSHSNIPVSSDAMSYTELKGAERNSATDVIVFDAISKNPLSAALTLQSIDKLLEVPSTGIRQIALPYLPRQSFLIHRGDDEYLPSLHSYIDSQDYIYTPLVNRKWWDSLKEHFENDLTEKGHVVGYVEGDNFSVTWSDGKGTEMNPLYFDSEGQIVEAGVAGGGFIFPGIKPGSGSLTVLGASDPFVHSQLSAAEKGMLSVHYFQLGRL